ncbi:hypothetical protein H9Q70_014583 [Fusarium xylarioides]|nr:hypothetical protein H9Q70_014583 [Fusarium xylarioides]
MDDSDPDRSSDEDQDDLEDLLFVQMLEEISRLQPDQEMPQIPHNPVPRYIVNPGGPSAAAAKAQRLLRGSPARFFRIFRVPRGVFDELVEWLRENTALKDTKWQTLEQKVMIFLYVIGQGVSQHLAADFFEISQSTVSVVVTAAAEAFLKLHVHFVRLPDDSFISLETIARRSSQYFHGCIGAVDGTHLAAYIPSEEQRKWYNRKSLISQNVLCAVQLDGTFSYVLAGCEGSVNDASLMRHACSKSLKIPKNRFYVGDAGFGSRQGLIVPYAGVRYHLNDWKITHNGPQDEKELYNLRQSRLRIIIELAFGRVKRKFRILRCGAPEYSIYKQILFIYACTGLMNFISSCKADEEADEEDEEEREVLEEVRDWADKYVRSENALTLRLTIANKQWKAHKEYRAEVREVNRLVWELENLNKSNFPL